ncbi:hypothetical protein ACLOJK_011966 [Asimina triloba]
MVISNIRVLSVAGNKQVVYLRVQPRKDADSNGWKHNLFIFFLILVWLVVIIQCISGSDVLRSALEEDEVHSVARLLGDLVVYRASGTGHLELLAVNMLHDTVVVRSFAPGTHTLRPFYLTIKAMQKFSKSLACPSCAGNAIASCTDEDHRAEKKCSSHKLCFAADLAQENLNLLEFDFRLASQAGAFSARTNLSLTCQFELQNEKGEDLRRKSAGLALLQNHQQSTNSCEELMEAPESPIQEALIFHPFAEAAYTVLKDLSGPLLDVGRNPLLFPCAWLYRQGVLTPWSRNSQRNVPSLDPSVTMVFTVSANLDMPIIIMSCFPPKRGQLELDMFIWSIIGNHWKLKRPVLEGDNWWRGHAAAFLAYVKLSPEALRRGRVSQAKREAAYFFVVLHHLRTVVIAVRGTETPEDLITDGLCRECPLLPEDVDGLIKKIHQYDTWKQLLMPCSPSGEHVPFEVRRSVLSSFPHYGHSGIVEAARELFMQIDEKPVGEG